MSVIIHQNPNLITQGGFETLKKSMFPNTAVGYELFIDGGRVIHGLKDKEVKQVEDYFGYKFNTPEGRAFYCNENSRQTSNLGYLKITDKIIALNFDNPKDLLTYRSAVAYGFIAENISDTEDPLCTALFYVYNSDEENAYKAEINEIKGDVVADLTILKRKDTEKLIKVCKYLFETYDNLDTNKAYNKIMDYVEANTKLNRNIYHVQKVLELKDDELNLTVDVKESISRGLVSKNTKGYYYNKLNNTEYGKNLDEVLNFVSQNPDELGTGGKEDTSYAIRRQLKIK